ncbi:type VI secretion system lipoprotein TssJ [Azonexus caeni]|jgi:type VI secretion system protein VasD|uniref:type VI secretion system lipoprotein TssJ n=1 Tax=Azonexus caeni TaxID=266126 RepID=UPI003A8621F6
MPLLFFDIKYESHLSKRPRVGALLAAALLATNLTGCATSGVQVAGAAIGAVLEAGGLIKRDGRPRDIAVKLVADKTLNQTSEGVPMSLVAKIYVLRSPERLRSLSYTELSESTSEATIFGDDLISTREVVLIPGKSYDLSLKIPSDARTLAIVGMYRSPSPNRWRIALDAQESVSDGIIATAHACALSLKEGILVNDISAESVRSLPEMRCNG